MHAVQRGDRVTLVARPEGPDYEHYEIGAGDHGVVDIVDSLGTVHIKWDNGCRVGIIARHRDLIRKVR